MALCWLSLALLPVGLMGVASSPCAGPRNAAGSAILLVVGLAAVAGSIYGGARILRFFRVAQLRTKLLGILSLLCGCFATFVGGIYLLIGAISSPLLCNERSDWRNLAIGPNACTRDVQPTWQKRA
jgi:hypothetical protein